MVGCQGEGKKVEGDPKQCGSHVRRSMYTCRKTDQPIRHMTGPTGLNPGSLQRRLLHVHIPKFMFTCEPHENLRYPCPKHILYLIIALARQWSQRVRTKKNTQFGGVELARPLMRSRFLFSVTPMPMPGHLWRRLQFRAWGCWLTLPSGGKPSHYMCVFPRKYTDVV